MTVYVVIKDFDYDGQEIYGIYSSRNKAEQEKPEDDLATYYIESHILDA